MAKDICVELALHQRYRLMLNVGVALFSGGQCFGCKGNRASIFYEGSSNAFLGGINLDDNWSVNVKVAQGGIGTY